MKSTTQKTCLTGKCIIFEVANFASFAIVKGVIAIYLPIDSLVSFSLKLWFYSTKQLLGNVITLKKWKLVVSKSDKAEDDHVYFGVTAYLQVSLLELDTKEGFPRWVPNYLFYEKEVVRLINRIKHYEINLSLSSQTREDKSVYNIFWEELQNESFEVRFLTIISKFSFF